MTLYVLFGGMIATTWVQIIKAVLLLGCATIMAFAVLASFGFSPDALFARAVEVKTELAAAAGAAPAEAAERGASIMGPGNFIKDPISAISFGMALMFGTAGLPHILMRFFTVPDAQAARKSVLWATGWIGYFYLLTFIIGFGAIVLVGDRSGLPRRRRHAARRRQHGRDPPRRRDRRQPVPRLRLARSPSRPSWRWSPG